MPLGRTGGRGGLGGGAMPGAYQAPRPRGRPGPGSDWRVRRRATRGSPGPSARRGSGASWASSRGQSPGGSYVDRPYINNPAYPGGTSVDSPRQSRSVSPSAPGWRRRQLQIETYGPRPGGYGVMEPDYGPRGGPGLPTRRSTRGPQPADAASAMGRARSRRPAELHPPVQRRVPENAGLGARCVLWARRPAGRRAARPTRARGRDGACGDGGPGPGRARPWSRICAALSGAATKPSWPTSGAGRRRRAESHGASERQARACRGRRARRAGRATSATCRPA